MAVSSTASNIQLPPSTCLHSQPTIQCVRSSVLLTCPMRSSFIYLLCVLINFNYCICISCCHCCCCFHCLLLLLMLFLLGVCCNSKRSCDSVYSLVCFVGAQWSLKVLAPLPSIQVFNTHSPPLLYMLYIYLFSWKVWQTIKLLDLAPGYLHCRPHTELCAFNLMFLQFKSP